MIIVDFTFLANLYVNVTDVLSTFYNFSYVIFRGLEGL